MIVDVRAVPDREKTASYIADYVSKPAHVKSWSHEEICEYAMAMHGRRLLHTFGGAHGAKVEPTAAEIDSGGSEFIAPLRPMLWAARCGDMEARHAIEILRRISGVYAEASGHDRLPKTAVQVEVEEWEHKLVIDTAYRCFSDELAAQEKPGEAASPPRRETPPDAALFDDVTTYT